MSTWCALLLGVICCVATAPAAEAEVALRVLTEEEVARYRADRKASAAEGAAEEALSARALSRKVDEEASEFMIPRVFVDTSSPFAPTTLFSVRNREPAAHEVLIIYYDSRGNPLASELPQLEPFEIFTRNLRDVPEVVAQPGTLATGFVLVAGAPGADLWSDWFQVDPDNDFATGSRAIDVESPFLCDFWDVRHLVGGLFSGGTDLHLVVNDPLGADPDNDPPSVIFTVRDEAGTDVGVLVGLWTEQIVVTTPMGGVGGILDALGPGAPPFGGIDVDFSPSGGGVVGATYSADGRFSIGLDGTCTDP